MPNRLDLPPELTSLIEKREKEERRKQDSETQPEASGESPRAEKPIEERRAGKDRRSNES